MWSKVFLLVVIFGGLMVVTGCNRVGPGDSPNAEQEEPALKDADAYATRAYDWLCKGNYDKAIRDYDNAFQLKPVDAGFVNSRGFTWHMKSIQEKDRAACEDRALADYAEAIRIDPKYASAINIAPGFGQLQRLNAAEMANGRSRKPRRHVS